MLGMHDFEGSGVSPNLIEAYKWISIAAKLEIPQFRSVRDDLASKLSPADLTEAKRRAAEFLPKPIKAKDTARPEPSAIQSHAYIQQPEESLAASH